jgi:C-terminal processing protease CtpA/Prc
MIPDEECRCVDADGNEIENCRCFRTLDRGQFSWTFSSADAGRPRIGITLSTVEDENASQGATVQEVMEDGPAHRAGLREGDIITHLDGQSLFDRLDDEDAEADLDLDGSLPAQRLLHLAHELEPGDEVEVRYLRDGTSETVTITADDLGGWGGNYVFMREGPGGQWDPENLRGAWNIQEYSGNWKKALEDFQNQWDSEEFQQQWKESMEEFQNQWNSEEFRQQWEEMAEQFKDQNWRSFKFHAPEGEGNVVFWSDEDEPKVAFEAYSAAEPFSFYFGSVGGLQLEELNPDLGEYFGTESGVLVTDVDEDSTLGLQAGDVILRVGDREVTDANRLRKILSSYEADEEITLHIMRQQREMTVSGTMGR